MSLNKPKALVLFSGGLDSLLSAIVLREQGVGVDAICFTSNFFSSTAAKKAAVAAGIKLVEHDISEELLTTVKNPPNGYGRHLNPCIDCHALMMKKAVEIMRRDGYDLIATGEVLGQRPFSQTKGALARIDKLVGAEILRPLSAKLLPITEAEKNGLVKRSKLYDISGRTRGRQMELAGRFNIIEYATPAGGCLLTDPEYSDRLLKLLEHWPDCSLNDVSLLRHGRIFWLKLNNEVGNSDVLAIIGRDSQDNNELARLAKKGDIMLELKEITGPTTLIRGFNELSGNSEINRLKVPRELKLSVLEIGEPKSTEEIISLASLLTAFYSVKARGKLVDVAFKLIN